MGRLAGWITPILLVGLAIAAHVVLGWAWSAVAGVAAGIWAVRRPIMTGTLVVGVAWALLVCYNLAIAPYEVNQYFQFLSRTASMPAALVPVMSIGLGALLGGVAGWFGGSLSRAVRLNDKQRQR